MNKFFGMKTSTLIFNIAILSVLGAGLATYFSNTSQSITVKKHKEAVLSLIAEVWSKGNLQLVDQLIAPQYTIKHDPGDQWEGKTIDLATFKERVKMSRHVFPDQKFYIEDIVSEGDKVAVSWRFTGTQKGNIPGLGTTNKTVNVSGLTIYYFSNDKIIGHWQVVDRLGFLNQLVVQGKPNSEIDKSNRVRNE